MVFINMSASINSRASRDAWDDSDDQIDTVDCTRHVVTNKCAKFSHIHSLCDQRRPERLSRRVHLKTAHQIAQVTTYIALYLASPAMKWCEFWYNSRKEPKYVLPRVSVRSASI